MPTTDPMPAVTGGYPATGRSVAELRQPPASVCAEPLTLVRWEDTTNIASWQTRPEVVEFATDGGWICENVGWLVHEDDDCLVLAARRSADSERHVGLSERIPKRAIIHRGTLAEGPDVPATEHKPTTRAYAFERRDRLTCGTCGSPAYVCDRPHRGTATWAIHCTSKPHHNYFAEADDARH